MTTPHDINPWLDVALMLGTFALMLVFVVGLPAMCRWFIKRS